MDFGLAFDFTDIENNITVNRINKITLKYYALEIANYKSRNILSDIWSLGVIFLEITIMLKNKTVEFIYEFLLEHGLQ
jgi:serine/threonine protein kinase